MFARNIFGKAVSPLMGSFNTINSFNGLAAINVCQGPEFQQVRHAANLKAVKARIKSVQNIRKITKAMKMVAAAKMKADNRRMEVGQPFVKPVQNLLARLPREDKAGPLTLISVAGDKGLCGGVNTQVARMTRLTIQEEEAKGNQVKVLQIGSKGVAILKRLYGDRFLYSFEDVAKVNWNFTTASMIAERVIASNPQRLKIISNKFKSLVVYETTLRHLATHSDATTMEKSEWSKAMDVYSFEPSIYEVWADLHEFYLGTVIHGAYLEAATSEQSARMGAMENASKNASEMIDKLSLIYNRARQAKITTELCEIISGASAV